MRISACLNPQTIINPYTKERQVVACGKCAACRNMKAKEMIQRLDQERYCWRYCWFFTLTYAPEHVPTLKFMNGIYYDNTFNHANPKGQTPFINLEEINEKVSESKLKSDSLYYREHSELYYLSTGDAQKFIKRLRKNIYDEHKRNSFPDGKEAYKIRFYLCGEYGPSTTPHRPHYHGLLFFSSEFTAAHIQELISKSWKFGFVNSSAVSDVNSTYVAKYLNCTTHLPSIYLHRSIRPFALYSKCPPLGTLAHSTEEIREIFYSASPDFVIHDHKKNAFDNVRLWRTYQGLLYPRLSGFSELSPSDRVTLYGIYQRYAPLYDADAAVFAKYVLNNRNNNYLKLPTIAFDYADFLRKRANSDNPIIRWYYISSRVCEQSRSFEIPIREYCRYIDLYYSNIEKQKIQKQYEYQENAFEQWHQESCIGIDRLWLESHFDLPLELLSFEEIEVLRNYNVDFQKFFSEDLSERSAYQASLLPENSLDYLCFKIDNEIIEKNSTKTKKKNEYLKPNYFGDF